MTLVWALVSEDRDFGIYILACNSPGLANFIPSPRLRIDAVQVCRVTYLDTRHMNAPNTLQHVPNTTPSATIIDVTHGPSINLKPPGSQDPVPHASSGEATLSPGALR